MVSSCVNSAGHVANTIYHGVGPLAEGSVGVDGVGPAVGGLGLYVAQGIVTYGFENKVAFGVAFQTNDEVGDVVMRLAIEEVRDGEAQAGVLHEGMDARMSVYVVGGRLLPSDRVGDDIVDVAVDDGSDVSAGMEVDFCR